MLGLLGLVAVFHRPLIHFTVERIAPRLAAGAGLKLALHSSGSLWSDWTLGGVRAETAADSWLPEAEAREIAASYDWRALWRGDWPAAVHSVTLRGVELRADLRALPSSPPESPAAPRAAGEAPPLVWPRRIEIDGLRAEVILADGAQVRVEGLRLIQPESGPGELAWNELSVTPAGEGLAAVLFPPARARLERRGQVLHLTGLDLPYELRLEMLELNLDEFEKGGLALALELTRAAARLRVSAELAGLWQKPLSVAAEATLAGLHARELATLPLPEGWAFENAAARVRVDGALEDWRALRAEAEVSAAALEIAGAARLDEARLAARLEDRRLRVESLEARRGGNQARLTASATLPEAGSAETLPQAWEASLEAELPEGKALLVQTPDFSGSLRVSAQAEGSGSRVAQARAELSGADLAWGGYRLPEARVAAALEGDRLRLSVPEIALGAGNTLAANAALVLNEALPLEADWRLRFESLPALLEATGLPAPPQPVRAALRAEGRVKTGLTALLEGDLAQLEAEATVAAREVRLAVAGATAEDAPPLLEKVELDAQARAGSAKLTRGLLRFDADNAITLTGEAGLAPPRAFAVEAAVELPRLAALQPLLRPFTEKAPSGGQLRAELAARGELSPWHAQGRVELNAAEVTAPGLPEPANVALNARFAGDQTEIARLEARLGPWSALLHGAVSPQRAAVEALALRHGETTLLTGHLRLPFDLLSAETQAAPAGEPLALQLAVKDLDPAALAAALGAGAVPAGRFDAQVRLDGRLPALSGGLNAKFVGSAPLMADLQPPVVELNLTLAEGELKVAARAAQAPLEPLTLEAALPFDAAAVAREPASLTRQPLQASLRLPETSLAFAASLAKDWIKELPARLSLEADLSGSLAEPRLRAKVALDCPEVLLTRPELPSVRDVKLRLSADDQTLRLEELSLLLAGGRVRAHGTAGLAVPANPEFDLALEAVEALVYRDASTSLRANAALRCQGPLKAARLAGAVELVRGRYYKNIDLAPALRLPSDAPAVPPDPGRAATRLELPAFLADWQFAVDLKTRDPVLLSGNLIHGAVSLDAALGGSGREPLLSGGARIEHLLLKLPFSLLKVTSGQITLQPERPFDPRVEVRAESQMPSHQVTVFASGPLSNVKTRLTSTPPLSETDIAALLATGNTLSGDASQAAAEAVLRGVYLYLSEFYRKTFNKEKVIDEKPPRFHFGFAPSGMGADRSVDAMQAIYDFNDRWRMSGQFAPSGRVRAALGYLIRFGKARAATPPVEEKKEAAP